jgi:hypothetical protein
MIEGKNIVVWFSCGAPSAVASKLIIEKFGTTNNIAIINNPVDEEDIDNRRFLNDISKWIGQPIESATNPLYNTTSAERIWEEVRYMSGIHGAPCTKILKKQARHHYENTHQIDFHVLGYAYDEQHRHERFIKFERENVIPILIEEKITKQECFEIIIAAGLQLPLTYLLGYPNANCIGCVKATSPTYWNKVRETHPEVFERRAEQSYRLGVRLVRYKGKRIFLHDLPNDAVGQKMKSYECGIFCETG